MFTLVVVRRLRSGGRAGAVRSARASRRFTSCSPVAARRSCGRRGRRADDGRVAGVAAACGAGIWSHAGRWRCSGSTRWRCSTPGSSSASRRWSPSIWSRRACTGYSGRRWRSPPPARWRPCPIAWWHFSRLAPLSIPGQPAGVARRGADPLARAGSEPGRGGVAAAGDAAAGAGRCARRLRAVDRPPLLVGCLKCRSSSRSSGRAWRWCTARRCRRKFEPVRFYGQWLAERNLGLVPIARPAAFAWPGYWLARVRAKNGDHAVLMYGSPSGPVHDPAAALAAGGTIKELAAGAARPAAADRGAVRPRSRRRIIAAILLAADAEGPLARVEAAQAIAGDGLEGDRYFAGRGTFSNPGGRGYQLLLVKPRRCSTPSISHGSRGAATSSPAAST